MNTGHKNKFLSTKKKRNELIICIFIAIISLFYYLSYYKYFKIDVDEGLLINGAMRVLSGQLPLKDFHQYTPGRFYLLAVWFLIFGKSIAIERLLFAVLHIIKNILIFVTSKKIMPLPFNLIPVLLILLIPGFWIKAFVNLTLLINLFFIFRYLNSRSRKNLVLLGLSTGASLYFREDLAGYTCITVGILLVLMWISKKTSFKYLLKTGVTYAGAVILALLPMIILYWARGGIRKLVEGIYQTVKLGNVESFAFRSPLMFLQWPIQITNRELGLIFPYLSILLFFSTGILLFFRFIKKKSRTQTHDLLIFSTLILALLSFTHIWHWTHEFRIPQSGSLIHILWAYMIFQTFHARNQRKKGRPMIKTGTGAALAAAFVISLGIQAFLLFYSLSGHSMVQFDAGGISLRRGTHQKISESDRAKICPPQRQALVYNSLLKYISKKTSPNDTILCFGESPLYFLADRANATEFDNGRIPAYFPKQRAKFLKQIQQNKPKIIILREWEYKFWLPKMPEIFNEITRTYFWEREIFDFYIFSSVKNPTGQLKQGNLNYWGGNIEGAAEAYLKALEKDPLNPDLQNILNRLFSDESTSSRSLPFLEGYFLKRSRHKWQLRWGSMTRRQFSGEIVIQGASLSKDILRPEVLHLDSSSPVTITLHKDRVRFESQASNNFSGLDLVFADSHPFLTLIFDLKIDDKKTGRILAFGKGLMNIDSPLSLNKREKK